MKYQTQYGTEAASGYFMCPRTIKGSIFEQRTSHFCIAHTQRPYNIYIEVKVWEKLFCMIEGILQLEFLMIHLKNGYLVLFLSKT